MSEHDEQCALVQWARLREGQYPSLKLLFSVPNGAKLPYLRDKRGARYSPQAARLLAEGMRAGVPDLCLPVPNGEYCGLFIEMKAGKNQPTEEQRAYLDALAEQGYCAVVCWGWDDARRTICGYLGMEE